MERIYLDANATTPLDPRVQEAMVPWLGCGNASSPHGEGRAARAAIDRAREQVAALVGASPREIVFTSGATEANAIALLGSIRALGAKRVFTTAIEHPSVLRTLEALRPGVDVVVAPVGPDGRVPDDTTPPRDAALVSVMLANNETGAVQPVQAIATKVKEAGGVMHTDAVQACGKMRVDVDDLAVDLLTLSAHKMHGPKGAGALYVRRGTGVGPLYHGGEHERAVRAGTENVAAIVGLGAAAELAAREADARRALWHELGARLLAGLRDGFPDARLNLADERVPNTFSFTFPDVEGEAVLLGLDLEGVAVATGSACSSGAAEPSHVLQAMGLSRADAERSLRVSLHAHTTAADVDACLNALARVVKSLRALHV